MAKITKTNVTLSKRQFVAEHEDLVKTLKSGNKAGIRREIKEQSAELKEVKAKK